MLNLRLEIRRILSENEDFWSDEHDRLKKKFSKIRKNPKTSEYKVVGFDSINGLAILKNNESLYAFYYAPLPKESFMDYVEYAPPGEPDIDQQAIENYVNDNILNLKKGFGLVAWESGEGELVRIDQELKERLLKDFSKSSSVIKSLS